VAVEYLSDRAISPVIGTILMVAIIVILAAIAATFVLDFSDETDPQPNVVLEGEGTDDVEYKFVHDGGETIDGDNLEIRGAANPEVAAGKTLTTGDEVSFLPTQEEITIVWYGENDESYTLKTLTADQTLPAPDEGCAWVDSETNGGVDPIKIDDTVVNCDVETDEQVEIQNGGVVIGDSLSDLKDLDADNAQVYGDVSVEKVLNLQDGKITGSATSSAEDVKIDNGTIGGSIEAEKVAEVTGGSVVEGDMESMTKDTKILGDSTVEGSVTADGIVKLQDSEITGDVYIDSADFDCTNSTINGQDCASYTPENPADW
jgi:flagellin-like protein